MLNHKKAVADLEAAKQAFDSAWDRRRHAAEAVLAAKLASVEHKQIIVDGEALDLGLHKDEPIVLQAIAVLGAASAAAREAKKQHGGSSAERGR